jgi:hypothetical protein
MNQALYAHMNNKRKMKKKIIIWALEKTEDIKAILAMTSKKEKRLQREKNLHECHQIPKYFMLR